MSIEASEKVRVKNEPISDSQSISINHQPNIKQERQSIPISYSKRTREAISSDDQPNKRKRQSMKVKEEPIDIEMQVCKSQIEVKAEEEEEDGFSEFDNKRSIQTFSIATEDQPNKPKPR